MNKITCVIDRSDQRMGEKGWEKHEEEFLLFTNTQTRHYHACDVFRAENDENEMEFMTVVLEATEHEIRDAYENRVKRC